MKPADIGSRIRLARERLGWSREELAFRSGISWSGIAQIEAGRRTNLRPATLSALAGALGVTIDYLVRGAEPGPVMLDHRLLLYRTDDELATAARDFLAAGLDRSEALVTLTTRENIELIRKQLGRDARHVEFVESATWLTEPAAALARIKAAASAKLEEGACWIRFLGEPIWGGRSESEVRRWTRFESLINLVFAGWPMTVVCPYDERSARPRILREAMRTHPTTMVRGEVAPSPDFADPGGFVL